VNLEYGTVKSVDADKCLEKYDLGIELTESGYNKFWEIKEYE